MLLDLPSQLPLYGFSWPASCQAAQPQLSSWKEPLHPACHAVSYGRLWCHTDLLHNAHLAARTGIRLDALLSHMPTCCSPSVEAVFSCSAARAAVAAASLSAATVPLLLADLPAPGFFPLAGAFAACMSCIVTWDALVSH